MSKNTRVLSGLMCSLLTGSAMMVAGCEKPAPPAVGKSQNAGGISGLAEQPQSVLGKSAARGRDVATQIETQQAQTAALADQLTGQAGAGSGNGDGVVKVSGLEFRPPTGWTQTPPQNRMQSAAYLIGEATGGAQAGAQDTICVWLAGIGGSVADNIARWRGQMKDPSTNQSAESKVETRTIAGLKVTFVSMSGTYSSMTGGVPTPIAGTGFRGAIVETDGGNVYVRLTGPKAAVESAVKSFDAMIAGLKKS